MLKSKRDLRQEGLVEDWWDKYNAISYCICPTGFGKSRVGCLAIEKLETKSVIHVVSPTIKIKEQWETLLSKYKEHQIECFVINTYAKSKHDCDLLIIDELHSTLNADTSLFKYALLNSNKKKFLGLSATVRSEEELYINTLGIYKSGEVTIQEALAEGYIAPYIEYNLGITMSETDNIVYRKINKDYSYHFEIFNRDFNLAMACLQPKNAEDYASRIGSTKSEVQFHAVRFTRLMRERKDFLHRTPSKLELTKQIINKFNTSKIITFGQVTDTADKLTSDLPEISISYHSNVEPIKVNGKVLKGKKCLDYKINQFVDNRYKIRVVNTVKFLSLRFLHIMISSYYLRPLVHF